MIKVDVEKVYKDALGLWVSGLFSAISGNNPQLPFCEQKDIFFSLLRTWLAEGRILFCDPCDPLGAPWKADVDEIVDYLQARWPVSVDSEYDPDLNVYFYEIPAILWVGPSGEIIGS
ncbi:hypothetical protein [Chromobacterium violaceum]|uniref:hypothetical protein n=1 Tax=Chromobacterium violaceum TaxID=536 RepID=UPI000A763F5C|nr:hypothetical protein [Chromobacterium violaceum]